MTALPARPTIPARPAAYVRDPYSNPADDMTAERTSVLRQAQDLGWPTPTVYAEGGRPGSQLAALVEAITAGRHDGVFTTEPSQLGDDLAQIEAFDRLCREHGVPLLFRWYHEVTDTRALFGAICNVTEFTVTDEHLGLLRRAYIWWDEAEFGAPSINPKRPYGNSNVYADVAEILGVPDPEWADEELGPLPDTAWRFLRLHVETAIALQIALATGEFRTGHYVRDDKWDSRRWRRDET